MEDYGDQVFRQLFSTLSATESSVQLLEYQIQHEQSKRNALLKEIERDEVEVKLLEQSLKYAVRARDAYATVDESMMASIDTSMVTASAGREFGCQSPDIDEATHASDPYCLRLDAYMKLLERGAAIPQKKEWKEVENQANGLEQLLDEVSAVLKWVTNDDICAAILLRRFRQWDSEKTEGAKNVRNTLELLLEEHPEARAAQNCSDTNLLLIAFEAFRRIALQDKFDGKDIPYFLNFLGLIGYGETAYEPRYSEEVTASS